MVVFSVNIDAKKRFNHSAQTHLFRSKEVGFLLWTGRIANTNIRKK